VCMGNICRSPTAHGVFLSKVAQAGLQDHIEVDSAGTGSWHVGEAPDQRATAAAARRDYDLSPLRARQAQPEDFLVFDYVLVMDKKNLRDLKRIYPAGYKGRFDLFMSFAGTRQKEVPDPYYGGPKGFEKVLDMVEAASEALLEDIKARL
ncbi:MAG: low molecular weight phosphotyrosine protein phosphatase, partial [Marinobacterium sp.]|nr:low molecular weight phosphotyrosine protein phosphatase [Marinobacterium sp.]